MTTQVRSRTSAWLKMLTHTGIGLWILFTWLALFVATTKISLYVAQASNDPESETPAWISGLLVQGFGLWAVATLIASIALPIYALKSERLKGFRTRSRILIQFLFTGQPLVWPPEAREE